MGGVFPSDNEQVFNQYSRHPVGYTFKDIEGAEYEVIPGDFKHAMEQNKEQTRRGLAPIWVADVREKEIKNRFDMEDAIYDGTFIRLWCPVMKSAGIGSDGGENWELSRIDSLFLNLRNIIKIERLY